MLTGEPYHIDSQELAAFAEELKCLGLSVSVSADSPYYPGHTQLVMVQRER